jgi:thiopurine S-methyltransferase
MKHDFWLERWQQDQLGWHLPSTNPLLEKHWPGLGITRGAAVFVPLCGKSLDMRYLEEIGHSVTGIELSEKAVQAYFEEAGETPEREELFYLTRYQGPRSTLYCGDFFDISAPDILGVRAVYDRGALVALPPGLREQYADHMLRVIPEHAHILLISLEYDQNAVPGPPHSVTEAEVEALFGSRCRIELLERTETSNLPPHFVKAGLERGAETVFNIIKDH